MKRRVTLEKALGETPLGAIARFKARHAEYLATPASYAGRLDPMATGKLLILLGDECKRQKTYTKLDKEYEIEVLLGISSDTGDVLGIPKRTASVTLAMSAIRHALQTVTGTHTVPYPIYSSKTVNGKPLFLHALEGSISDIHIPRHKETIHSITLLTVRNLTTDELRIHVERMLAQAPTSEEPSKALGADFRIRDVRAGWSQLLSESATSWQVLTLRVVAGSGTYMRTLANRIARELGTEGIAIAIHRTKIGRYVPFLRLWSRTY